MQIEKFTLIGATTRWACSLRQCALGSGSSNDSTSTRPAISSNFHRTAEVMQVEIDEEGAQEIAKRSRGTPRVANRLLPVFATSRRCGRCTINRKVAADALLLLEVDQLGSTTWTRGS